MSMRLSFNGYTIDSDRYRLDRNGSAVDVDPLVFNLLVYLIENRDRVVTREELFDTLWAGKVVTYAALAARIRDARRVVADDGRTQAVIETCHGRGYRFIARIETDTNSQYSNGRTGGISETSNKPSIAVLPFSGPDAAQADVGLTQGITEEIIDRLSRVPGLLVIASYATMDYRDRTLDLQSIGQELNVAYLLAGGCRRVGNTVRVNPRLLDARSGEQIWAGRYQSRLKDIFALQDEIAQQVAVELQVKLVTGEYARLWSSGTESLEAWELLIQARESRASFTPDDNLVARRLLERALEYDPNYASAWANLGFTYWREYNWGWGKNAAKSLKRAESMADRTLQCDPKSPEGYALFGHIYMVQGQGKRAIEMQEKALELAPGDSRMVAFLGNVLIDAGRIKQGVQKMKHAIRLCPVPLPWYLLVLGAGLHLDDRNDEAEAVLFEACEKMPQSVLPCLWLASLKVSTGSSAEAHKLLEQVHELDPTFSIADWATSFRSESHNIIRENLNKLGIL